MPNGSDAPDILQPQAWSGDPLAVLLADAGVGVTVHGARGEILVANSVAITLLGGALLWPGRAGRADAAWEIVRADGTPMPPDEQPVRRAIVTRQPVRQALLGVRHATVADHIWLRVDALPCIALPPGRLRVVCLLTAVAPPAEEQNAGVAVAPPRRLDEPFPEIDGHSPPIRRLKQHMARVASDPDVTVLVLGESGTGKEQVARGIHLASPRRRSDFVVVNCAGLAPGLVEDELFGHVRGAFTGAVDDKAGPFERASGGTVFLDEIGDLTPELQMKLLRTLQQRTVQRLGGRREQTFDARVIAATHVDLAGAVARGRFREDLYYRLKVYELKVPPLRARGMSDLRELAGAILAKLAARRRRRAPALDADALALLGSYSWPGNVRELENTLEYMLVAAGVESPLTAAHLPDGFGRLAAAHPVELVGAGMGGGLARAPRPLPAPADVLAALERSGSHRGRAAAALGLSRHQLYRLIQRYGFPRR